MWTIEKHSDGSFVFRDKDGIRGRYRDADVMATHAAFAMQELERARKLIADIDQAFKVPAAEYTAAVVNVISLIDKAKPIYKKIPVGS